MHRWLRTRPTLTCDRCRKSFHNKYTKELHMRQHRTMPDNPAQLSPHSPDPVYGTPEVLSSESDLEDPHLFRQTAVKKRILSKLTDEQIMLKLVERRAAFMCQCGMIFSDQGLFSDHKEFHSQQNPKQCRHCGYVAQDWPDFMRHIFSHGKHKTQMVNDKDS